MPIIQGLHALVAESWVEWVLWVVDTPVRVEGLGVDVRHVILVQGHPREEVVLNNIKLASAI